MRKYKKEIFIMVNLFFSIAAITMSIFIFLKTFSYEFEKCGNIFKEIYLMRLNFLELLMVVITAILAILSIAVPLMAYNWNRDMKADFEKLKRDIILFKFLKKLKRYYKIFGNSFSYRGDRVRDITWNERYFSGGKSLRV